jgi:hypothetical protein
MDALKALGAGHYNDTMVTMLLKRFSEVNLIFLRNHGFILIAPAALVAFDLLYFQKRRLNLFSYFYALILDIAVNRSI